VSGRVVGVPGVETNQRIGQVRRGEQGAGGGHFVVLLAREYGGAGDGGAGFLRDEADDLGESVGNRLAVERGRRG